mgnify:FL=1
MPLLVLGLQLDFVQVDISVLEEILNPPLLQIYVALDICVLQDLFNRFDVMLEVTKTILLKILVQSALLARIAFPLQHL